MIRLIRRKLGDWRYRFFVDHCPRKVLDKIWMRDFGYTVDWEHPRDLNEKIEWLICYGDTSIWPDLTDKYKVRDYVRAKGLGHLLTKLYGVWGNANQIDYDSLPDKFVLKCNHDCGSYHIVDKNIPYSKDAINASLNKCLKRKFGYQCCEPHYNKIKPLIIAEEYLEQNCSFSSSLVDYKVWCFGGKARSICVYYNRSDESVSFDVYDLEWRNHPEKCVFSSHFKDGKGMVERPNNLEEMIAAAELLSEGLPEARVDFYIINDSLKFGEITLTSGTGRMKNFSESFLKEMGNFIALC